MESCVLGGRYSWGNLESKDGGKGGGKGKMRGTLRGGRKR